MRKLLQMKANIGKKSLASKNIVHLDSIIKKSDYIGEGVSSMQQQKIF